MPEFNKESKLIIPIDLDSSIEILKIDTNMTFNPKKKLMETKNIVSKEISTKKTKDDGLF